ncbi:MAG: HEAT repeat domain-containing protein [Myxococcales bacterium]
MRARVRMAVCSVSMLWGGLAVGFDWPRETARIIESLEQTQDLTVRCDLVRLLGERADPSAEQALVGLLGAPRAELRREVVRALPLHPTEAARAGLVGALTDADATVRAAAAQGLGRIRSP